MTIVLCIAPSPALAEGSGAYGDERVTDERNWAVDLEILTDFPIHFGARIGAELPHRIRLGATLGYLPGGYVDVINAIVVSAGGYDEHMAELVRNSLENSLVFRFHLGWQPFEDYGFYFDVGYGLAALGGGADTESVLIAVTGYVPPPGLGVGDFSIHSTLHMMDVELGYLWVSESGWSIRAALGGAFTVGASVDVVPDFELLDPAIQDSVNRLSSNTQTLLHDILVQHVHSLVITVAVGYRF